MCYPSKVFYSQDISVSDSNIYYKYIVLCDDSIAGNSILEFAVMVFEKQVKSHGKVGEMSRKYKHDDLTI